MANNPENFKTPNYGLTEISDLFTARQQTALITYSDLIGQARARVLEDARITEDDDGQPLEDGGTRASAYADAVATYLSLAVSRTVDLGNSLVTWSTSRDQSRNLFAKQSISMAWPFVEVSPFAEASGDVGTSVDSVARAVDRLNTGKATVSQAAAQSLDLTGGVISTDPPYYHYFAYSDLSDFFYVWLRRSLGEIHPRLLGTLLTPKAEELVADRYRQGGETPSRTFFEEGFEQVFTNARLQASAQFPMTLYYAFKSEADADDDASAGWETILTSLIRSGWAITATWPMRSERSGRMKSVGTNSLASSIVLALRPRPVDAPTTDRRGFLAALRGELPDALRELQQGAIAPVDLPQAAIGPGMAVFTRYAAVLGNDGRPLPVREALQQINALLDEVLNEQEGDFDSDTRFSLGWFRLHGFGPGEFGHAENMANGRGASLGRLSRSGVLTAHGGVVRLLAPGDLPPGWDPAADPHLTVWEVVLHLSRVLAVGGVPAASALYRAVPGSVDLALAKELAYLLFRIAEQRKQTADAVAFNTLAAAWNEISAAATGRSIPAAAQLEIDRSTEDDF